MRYDRGALTRMTPTPLQYHITPIHADADTLLDQAIQGKHIAQFLADYDPVNYQFTSTHSPMRIGWDVISSLSIERDSEGSKGRRRQRSFERFQPDLSHPLDWRLMCSDSESFLGRWAAKYRRWGSCCYTRHIALMHHFGAGCDPLLIALRTPLNQQEYFCGQPSALLPHAVCIALDCVVSVPTVTQPHTVRLLPTCCPHPTRSF